jgi:hypothetical protein
MLQRRQPRPRNSQHPSRPALLPFPPKTGQYGALGHGTFEDKSIPTRIKALSGKDIEKVPRGGDGGIGPGRGRGRGRGRRGRGRRGRGRRGRGRRGRRRRWRPGLRRQ